ncbi:MAG: hypothetical protein GVY28_08845 [Alphaproteobacteria bacterium]|jgi:hypothetical protein|nr:hypothetical protein [Alphaproteobacteria bacterium]
MAADRTTDAIAHFIGLFELKVDEQRLRDAYEEFTAERRAAELEPLATQDAAVAAELDPRPSPYGPLRTDPGPVQPHPIPDVPRTFNAPDEGSLAADRPADSPSEPDAGTLLISQAGDFHFGFEAVIPIEVTGSIITVTGQTAVLRDNDTLGVGVFRDTDQHAADLHSFSALAAAVHAPLGFDPAVVPDMVDAKALASAMRDFAGGPVAGFDTFTKHLAASNLKIVNGDGVGSTPEWEDLLPAYHADSDPGARGDDGLPNWALPEAYTSDRAPQDGHRVVTGGNLLSNETAITLSWIDAPMIAVGGAWMDLSLVSQVAAVSNRDTGLPADRGGPSSVYQVVEIEEESHAAPWLPSSGNNYTAGPRSISVEILDGDLVVSNHVEQTIELHDNDHIGTSLTGAHSAFVLGDNTIANVTSLIEAGLGYDLILIEDDFISLKALHQTLVLQDDDWIQSKLSPLPAVDAPKPFAERGEAIDGVARSADETLAAEDAPSAGADAAEPQTNRAPDNLLMNKAVLASTGIDTAAEISASIAEMVSDSVVGLESLKERLLEDPALAGLEYARVLKINGDLIQSTTVTQTILASDRDDVRIDGPQAPAVDLVAGANALLNSATLAESGVDSVVMAENEPYSDLLIHQASLIDEPDLSTEAVGEIANEAVAFLMAEAQGETKDRIDESIAASGDQPSADAYDVMQGVLA